MTNLLLTDLLAVALLIDLLLLVVTLLVYRHHARETLSASAFRRVRAVGYREASLTHGITAYQDLQASLSATTIVLLHGATIGSMAYQPFALALAQRYRVITFDGFGRGFSDRVAPSALTMDVLVKQTLDLLDHLGIDCAVLYGISLGAALAARFAALHPERTVAVGFQVPLIKPPASGALTLLRSLYRLAPPIARWFGRVVVVPIIIARGENFSDEDRAVSAHFLDQFDVEGHEADLVTLLTGDAIHGDRTPDHAAIASRGLPVHFVYAVDDPEMPRALVEATIALYAKPDALAYHGGHNLVAEKHKEIADDFDRFLRGACDAGGRANARALGRRSKSPRRF